MNFYSRLHLFFQWTVFLPFLLTVACDYTLVPLNSDISVKEQQNQFPPDTDTSPEKKRRKIGAYTVYYGDLHNHTELSDGTGTPRMAYDAAKEAGLDFFGLSDHASMLTDEEWELTKATADSCNHDSEYVALWGFEWTSSTFGHSTVIGTEDFCTSIDPPTATFTGFLAWLSTRDCYAFFNHPNRYYPASFNGFSDTPSDKFVGMDLWNKSFGFQHHYYNDGFYPDDNMKGHFDEALSRGWRIGAGGSGDNHNGTWGTAVDWRIAVLAPACTRKDLADAFFARRFYSTLDKNIVLSFTANGSEMGSIVATGAITFTITAFDTDNEVFTMLQMYNGNHDVVTAWTPLSEDVAVTHRTTVDTDDYFYVKITQDDGNEAISSPIWVRSSDSGSQALHSSNRQTIILRK